MTQTARQLDLAPLGTDRRPAAPARADAPGPERWRYAVSLDTETSGTSTRCRIVQIAALRFRFRMPEGAHSPEVEFSQRFRLVSLVRPPSGTPFMPGAVAVTGIGWPHVRSAPMFHDVRDRLLEVLGELPLIAHNARFDRGMVAKEWDGHPDGCPIADARWICSLALARTHCPGNSHKLGDLTGRLGIQPSGRLHDAATDAELTARLYAHIVLGMMARKHAPCHDSLPLEPRC